MVRDAVYHQSAKNINSHIYHLKYAKTTAVDYQK